MTSSTSALAAPCDGKHRCIFFVMQLALPQPCAPSNGWTTPAAIYNTSVKNSKSNADAMGVRAATVAAGGMSGFDAHACKPMLRGLRLAESSCRR
jgi:hypothetical protein